MVVATAATGGGAAADRSVRRLGQGAVAITAFARSMLVHETRALSAWLALVKPFALQETMLPAAALLPAAEVAIDRFLVSGPASSGELIHRYLDWLHHADSEDATAEEAQRRFTFLRLRFNTALTQFDLFNDVITQRSENETGVWLSGLDVVAADALALPGDYYEAPPVICYLDRGLGAAIRRARTRLPGGGENPVAIIRVPRERMIGTGIASSLVHEVGHQGAALLDLVQFAAPGPAGPAARRRPRARRPGRCGSAGSRRSSPISGRWRASASPSTLGLMGVVSLPRAFVFRIDADDPHPSPWIRVKLSAAIGEALYPHPQWQRLSATWESFYPRPHDLEAHALLEAASEHAGIRRAARQSLPQGSAGPLAERGDGRRSASTRRDCLRLPALASRPSDMYRARPTIVFAVMGQARADGKLTPEDESLLLAKLLTYWALRGTLDMSEICADLPIARARAA